MIKFFIKLLIVAMFSALPGYVILKIILFKGVSTLAVVALIFCIVTSYVGFSFIFRQRKREKQYKGYHSSSQGYGNEVNQEEPNSNIQQPNNDNPDPESGVF